MAMRQLAFHGIILSFLSKILMHVQSIHSGLLVDKNPTIRNSQLQATVLLVKLSFSGVQMSKDPQSGHGLQILAGIVHNICSPNPPTLVLPSCFPSRPASRSFVDKYRDATLWRMGKNAQQVPMSFS